MTEVRELRDVNDGEEGGVVLLPTSSPAFAGDGDIDWVCPSCGAVLIRGALDGRQFLDLLIRCFHCGSVGATPRRLPGVPMAGRPVVAPPGKYLLGSSVDITGAPVMVASVSAAEDYFREVGRQYHHGSIDITTASLRQLADDAATALGAKYSDLQAADERGRTSRTPPARRHRLIELIAHAREVATQLEEGHTIAPDDPLLVELVVADELLSRWRQHPALPELVASLSGENETQHTVMLLSVAGFLVDAGNGVGIVTGGAGGRIPDLRAEVSLTERLDVEVKTPQDLRGPHVDPISADAASVLVERIINDAASAKTGQLDAEGSGVVVIGGFHLGPAAVDTLAAAAEGVLNRQAHRKGHLAGVVIADITYEVVDGEGARSRMRSIRPVMRTQLVRHPGYRGALSLEEEAAPTIPFPVPPE